LKKQPENRAKVDAALDKMAELDDLEAKCKMVDFKPKEEQKPDMVQSPKIAM
jgi:hypothetical protein